MVELGMVITAAITGLLVCCFISPLNEKWESSWEKNGLDLSQIKKDYLTKFRLKFVIVGVALVLALLLWMTARFLY